MVSQTCLNTSAGDRQYECHDSDDAALNILPVRISMFKHIFRYNEQIAVV